MIYYADQTHKDPTCIPTTGDPLDLTTLDYGEHRIFWALAPRWAGRVWWTGTDGMKRSYHPDDIVEYMVAGWHIFDPDDIETDEEAEGFFSYWYEALDIEIVWVLDTKNREFLPMAVEIETTDVYDVLHYRYVGGHSAHHC